MSERATPEPGNNVLPFVGRRPPADPRATDRVESQTLTLRVATTAAAGARLTEALADDDAEYMIVSLDGNVACRARLAIGTTLADSRRPGESTINVDWSAGTVANRGNRVALSRTELRLLNALMSAQGVPVPRAELIARAWPRDVIPAVDRENALAVYICGLRKRLAMVGLATGLETVRGVGYRLSF